MNSKQPLTYLIQCGENGAIKIGRSVAPIKRLINLQCHNSEKLRLLKITDIEESVLHQKFKNEKIRGEWYKPTDEILYFIASLKDKVYFKKKIPRKKQKCVDPSIPCLSVNLEKIKSEFYKMGLTQEQFVKKAGITRQTLCNIKKFGTCRISTLTKIEKVLNLPSRVFLNYANSPL